MRLFTSSFAVAAVAALSLSALPNPASACGGKGKDMQAVKTVSVGELAQLLDAAAGRPERLVVVDVNSPATRARQGVIPGAVLLTSSSQYATDKELPASKATPLVFYCANTRCGASKTAAERALQAGYVNVAILPEGIAGWREAQQPTQTPSI